MKRIILLATAYLLRPAAADCAVYTVQAGDTCVSIGRANNATYAQLLAWNSEIDVQCSNLGNLTGSELCVSNPLGDYSIQTNTIGNPEIVTTAAPVPSPTPDETNSNCGEYYLVESGQDCGTITTQFEITLNDFLFLNPQVWENCTNLMKDYYYCVRPVGYITSYPGYGGSTTTEPFVQTPSTPVPENPLANYSSSQPVIPIADDTRRDCYDGLNDRYIFFDNVTENEAADCWSLAGVVGITDEELILWNPSLSQNSTSVGPPSVITTNSVTMTITYNPFAYPCTLAENTSYCIAVASPTTTTEGQVPAIATPAPRAAGEIANCTVWFQILSERDTCETILDNYWLAFEELYAMNPSIKDDCSGLVMGTYYCISTYPEGVPGGQPDWTGPTYEWGTTSTSSGVSTPSPVQTGIVATCNEFYKVVAGDTCYDIAQDIGIDLDTFYKWNPAVKTDCSGLQADVYVCVGVSGSTLPTTTATTSGATTTITTGISTPTPTQTGMVENCGKFYLVQAGDGCWDLANEKGIALEDFYDWNPAVGDDCSGLQADVYVCVGLA
ncbi:hypothetical protein BDV11DRAFT_175388 [Aspergillus similis]